ncbi:MAG: acyl-CoA dehydrogenase family protein [Deltaproteobacteria bacterium]|nr:acyl-CoA dehydrogenase family protein [Deltaproteobacteria bacterium]
MRFYFTEQQEKFRCQVRDFLEEQLQAGAFSVHSASLVGPVSREFSRKMAEKGWIGLTWPQKYGGQGRTYVDKMILNEELFRVQAPVGYHFSADRQVGPALMKFGSEWQREHFLPRIVRAEEGIDFCLLFSEPNAGSDLASVATRAERDGDSYIVSGQKVWTSGGHDADYGWLLAKTNLDPEVRSHLSCSEFILDMHAPGVTVRPLVNIAGVHSFNEVFLDDVRVHERYLVGRENEGFKQIMAQVDYERAGIERLMQNYPVFSRLKDHVLHLDKTALDAGRYAWIRDALAGLEVDFQTGRLLCYYTAWLVDQGGNVSSQAALTKSFCTQFEQRVNDIALQILGPVGQIGQGGPWRPPVFIEDLVESYLWGPSYTLQGGSVEILKNIVAQRGLGLPRA